MVYLYLDAVMPNVYGVQKHPCFCFRKREARERVNTSQIDDPNYEASDPILIENLTKKFGKMKAVDEVTFSIK